MNLEMPPVVFLMGPTGAGKSACALALAARLPIEIISVDSAQVYRGLDIGTAKPNPVEQRTVRHHLIDCCDPTEAYSAARFRRDALLAIDDIRRRGRIPLLVGGTGLYFRALQYGLALLPCADPARRQQLEADYREFGGPAMHARLLEVDPVSASRIHPNDPQRTLRALEIHALTGRAMSDLLVEAQRPAPLSVLSWVVAPTERSTLQEGLAARFDHMLERGLINEVAGLRACPGLDLDKPAMRAVGYRAAWRYLLGELTYHQMVESAVIATRQLAKRQYTWFRATEDATWWNSEDEALVSRLCRVLESRSLRTFVDYT